MTNHEYIKVLGQLASEVLSQITQMTDHDPQAERRFDWIELDLYSLRSRLDSIEKKAR